MRYALEVAVREKYGENIPAAWLCVDRDQGDRVGGERRERKITAAAKRRDDLAECRDPEKCRKLAWRTGLDDILLDDNWLHSATGLSPAAFFYIVACFEEVAEKDPDAPLMRDLNEGRASDRGNRCILDIEHMICMTLHKMWAGCSQAAMQCTFKVDQTTISRNIAWVEKVLAGSVSSRRTRSS